MHLNLTEVNYLAAGVTGLIIFFLGGLWYQALFGKLWVKLHNYSEEQFKALQEQFSPAKFFSTLIASYLVLALGVAVIVANVNVTSAVGGLAVGFVLWLIVAAVGMTGHVTGNRHNGLYLIDTAFQLVIFLVAGAILAVWQ